MRIDQSKDIHQLDRGTFLSLNTNSNKWVKQHEHSPHFKNRLQLSRPYHGSHVASVEYKAEGVIRNAYGEADLTDHGTKNIEDSLGYSICGLVGAHALPTTYRL